MPKFETIEDILDYAMGEEEAARKFYDDMAARSDGAGLREVFKGFAREEHGHWLKLEALREGRGRQVLGGRVADMKLSDYLVEGYGDGATTYQEALILAMKKEKAAFRMYSDLAARSGGGKVRDTFLALAEEEARHKLRFEIEYDDNILKEN